MTPPPFKRNNNNDGILFVFYIQYVGKIGVAYFDEPSSSSGGTGQATNGIGGAGLMSLFGGGGGGGGGREGGGFLG